jgi:hypothetical protein
VHETFGPSRLNKEQAIPSDATKNIKIGPRRSSVILPSPA